MSIFWFMQLVEAVLAIVGLAFLARWFNGTRVGAWLSAKQATTTPAGEELLAAVEGVDLRSAWDQRKAQKQSEQAEAETAGTAQSA